jgi:hypothetical protein
MRNTIPVIKAVNRMKIDSKFTPGPWKVGSNKKGDEYALNVLAPIRSDVKEHRVVVKAVSDMYFDSETAEANARLTAAAPVMLEALKALFKECAMIHKHWGENSNTKAADEAIKYAQEAISKAEGASTQ